jgi:acyl-CoA dehydrogenase
MSELADLVRDVLGASPPELWETLGELGLTTIGVDEEAGGSGGTTAELAEVVGALAQAGRPTPLTEHATAAWALSGTAIRPQLATIAGPATEPDQDRVRLVVPWASQASHIVVPFTDGPVTVLDTSAAGVVVTAGSDVAGAPLDQVEAPAAALAPVAGLATRNVVARVATLRSVAMAAAAEAAYDITRAHVRTREQFGRPLVRIPAVATELARLRVEVIQARTAVTTALERSGRRDAHDAALAARVVCSRVAGEAARIAHQLHGALGITIEYRLHPVTRTLWALRDADAPEEYWATLLGSVVLERGESVLWDELTAVGPDVPSPEGSGALPL